MSANEASVNKADGSAHSSVEAALTHIARATNFYDFEDAWISGLRTASDAGGNERRDQVLAAAGRRLGALGELPDDVARRGWLRQVAEEVRLRGDGSLNDDLAAVAVAELREAFVRLTDDLAALRESIASDECLSEFAARRPRPAERIRDLGRIAEKLRGSGLLALCSIDDYEVALDLARAMKPPVHLVPTVPEMLRVSRDDLIGWAKSDRGDTEFPRLVRSLIAETEPSAEWIDIPAGTGVASFGFDGVVRCARGNRFVPVGKSAWELTAQQNGVKKKAGDDYKKRVESSTPDQRAEIAYVAAACSPWTKRRSFESERAGDDDFDRVRALNVDNLEDWLSCAIATTVWMRDQLGEPTEGISLLSSWWEQWLAATSPSLDANLVLAGREKAAADLREYCSSGRGVMTIGGHVHRDEAIAFVSAALSADDSDGMALTHVLYVDNHDTVARLFAQEALSTQPGPQANGPVLTLVVPSTEFAKHLPAGSPHRIVVPIPGSAQTEIALNSVDSAEVSKLFEDTGIELHTAQRLGGLARMSLTALRRHLSVEPALHIPGWAKGHVDQAIRRSLLLGGWNEAREGDHEIVERFVSLSYAEVTEALQQLDAGDSPIASTGDLWHSVSPADTWMLLRDQLAPSDLEEFVAIALDALPTSDPLRELSGEDAIRAQIEGVQAKYSSQLKHGMATTLALAGSNPPMPRGETTPNSSFAEGTTRRLLRIAMEDATSSTWLAITDVLPLLAEAAPDAVLESLRTCVAEQHAFSEAMFTDHDDRFFDFSAPSPHLRVLNALEVIAWSPDNLLAVADVLARLDRLDPGDGRYVNRPAATLASILRPWMPHTSASAEDRLATVEMLRRSHQSVAWRLMLSMLPRARSIQVPGARPRFRDWRPTQPVVTRGEHARTIHAIASMLIEDVGDDPERWIDVIGRVSDLPEEACRSAIATLIELAGTDPHERYKSRVWPILRDQANRHRTHRDARWALSESELDLLEQATERLRPTEPAISYGDLFGARLRSIDSVSVVDGYEAFQQALKQKQIAAVETILTSGGLKEILRFAESVEQPHRVGEALGQCDRALDVDVLTAMPATSDAITWLALGYFGNRFATLGWDGITRLISEHDVPPQVAADVIRALPSGESPWMRVEAFGAEVAAAYWERVGYYELRIPADLSQLLEVCRRLREAGRLDLARMLLATNSDDHESNVDYAEEVAINLELWVQRPNLDHGDIEMTSWELSTLLGVLDRHREHLGVMPTDLVDSSGPGMS